MKKFKTLTTEQVLAKLEKSLKLRRAAKIRYAKSILANPEKHYSYFAKDKAAAARYSASLIEDASKLTAFDLDGFKYMPRLRIFRHRHGYEYNPQTGEGDSHRALVINGVMQVHGYVYQDLFKALGIKFNRVHAPAGLDNLHGSVRDLASRYGQQVVLDKYKKGKRSFHKQYLKRIIADIQKLKAIGAIVPKGILEKAVEDAETERTDRLHSSAESRLRTAQYSLERAQAKGDLREVVQLTNKVERLKAKQATKAKAA